MQITETNAEGLKRTLKVVVPAEELGTRFSAKLGEVKDRVQLKGFRKGKVPEAHIRKVYGRSLMSEVLEQTIKETSEKAIAERKERPAQMPAIALTEDKDEIEKIIDGKADLAYEMSFEVLPKFELADPASLKLERLVADVDADALDKALADLVDRSVTYMPEDGRKAEDGDQLTIDFVGKIDGVEFEGGKGEALPLVLGKKQFIPGFEEGLIGAGAGDERTVTGTFPADYPMPALAGKEAQFDVKVNAVAKQVRPEIDEEFAKGFGAESVDNLKTLVGEQIKREYDGAARMKLKRELLDSLEQAHTFELPPSLVDREFESVWNQVTMGLQRDGKTFADEGKTEEDARAEYRKIAERRVRLGLVVGEIGDKQKIEVTQEELRKALMDQARRYPGQEKFVYEYFQKTPGAIQELRAPIFEDKVVDYLLSVAKPVDKKVSREELFEQVKEVTES
ncbi:MAG: trigger factor [Hyphomicrobiaceae bacterium]|nr:trigger factor [Hyphomicrobiaceae bacterium]